MKAQLAASSAIDQDFLELLHIKPVKVSASMLASQRESALRELKQKEEVGFVEIQDSLVAVRQAKMKHFKLQLSHDQAQLETVKGALGVLSTKLYIKRIEWLRTESAKGKAEQKTMQFV